MKHILVFSALSAGIISAHAQELLCDVTIIPPQVITGDAAIFKTMETAIEDFMNSRAWTTDQFAQEEKIVCTVQITIEQQVNQRQFKGNLQVASSRPVYYSDYKTPVVSLNDRDFDFVFQENTRIEWSQDQHRDNLSSVLAYYAYFILGMDYDTFSPLGGTPYFVMCQTIVNNAQNAPEAGWRSNEKSQQNRYWLIDNILSQTFKPMRDCMYDYHRKGFDRLYAKPAEARQVIADALIGLRNVHKMRPASYNMQIFFYAKADEIVNLFKPTEVAEKQKVYDLVKQVDPGNITKYEKIMN